jgi:3-deoxy-alpha-D-manno-octulosonate 8-oxidase
LKTIKNTFRPFKQVPKLIFGENSINRIHELIEFDLKNNYVLFIVDEYFKNKKFKIYDLFDSEVEFFASKKSEPKTSQIDNLKLKILKKQKRSKT